MLTSLGPAAGQITGDVRVSGHPKVQATFARVMGEHSGICLAVCAEALHTAWCAICHHTLAAHLVLPLQSLQHVINEVHSACAASKILLKMCSNSCMKWLLPAPSCCKCAASHGQTGSCQQGP